MRENEGRQGRACGGPQWDKSGGSVRPGTEAGPAGIERRDLG